MSHDDPDPGVGVVVAAAVSGVVDVRAGLEVLDTWADPAPGREGLVPHAAAATNAIVMTRGRTVPRRRAGVMGEFCRLWGVHAARRAAAVLDCGPWARSASGSSRSPR